MKTLMSRLLLLALALSILWFVTKDKPLLRAEAEGSFTTCGQAIADVASAVQECSDLNRNTACYGKEDVFVDPPEYRFQALRDHRPLEVLNSIDTIGNGWVLMNLQIAGETALVKAILFGPTELNATEPGAHDFLMRIDDQNLLCQDTPPGMVVSTVTDTTSQLTVNGIPIMLGSTAFVTAKGDSLTTIANLDGHVAVTIDDEKTTIPAGYQVQVERVDGQLRLLGPPTPSSFAASPLFHWLLTADGGLKSIRNTNSEDSERACVRRIDFGETITEQITNPSQECLIQFCANAGDIATVKMEGVNQDLDSWVDLQTPDKALFAFNDDVDSANDDSLLCNVELPVSSCDYTIVARSNRNRSEGEFRLKLDKATGCKPPTPRCTTVSRFGAQLYKEPKADAQRAQKVPAETNMTPQRYSDDGNWIEVSVEASGQTGWVRNDTRFVQCETNNATAVRKGSRRCTSPASGKYPFVTDAECRPIIVPRGKQPDTPLEPPTAEPPTAEPPTAEPPTAEPPTAEPPTAAPPTTEPPTAEPPTAEPPTAEPPTIEPPTTEPPTTEPPTTEPPTIEPPIVTPTVPPEPAQ